MTQEFFFLCQILDCSFFVFFLTCSVPRIVYAFFKYVLKYSCINCRTWFWFILFLVFWSFINYDLSYCAYFWENWCCMILPFQIQFTSTVEWHWIRIKQANREEKEDLYNSRKLKHKRLPICPWNKRIVIRNPPNMERIFDWESS